MAGPWFQSTRFQLAPSGRLWRAGRRGKEGAREGGGRRRRDAVRRMGPGPAVRMYLQRRLRKSRLRHLPVSNPRGAYARRRRLAAAARERCGAAADVFPPYLRVLPLRRRGGGPRARNLGGCDFPAGQTVFNSLSTCYRCMVHVRPLRWCEGRPGAIAGPSVPAVWMTCAGFVPGSEAGCGGRHHARGCTTFGGPGSERKEGR